MVGTCSHYGSIEMVFRRSLFIRSQDIRLCVFGFGYAELGLRNLFGPHLETNDVGK